MADHFDIDELRNRVVWLLDSLDARVPVAAIQLFQVDPSRELLFVESAKTLADAALRIPGCNVYSAHKSLRAGAASSSAYLIFEDWQSREAFRTCWDSSELRHFQEQLDSLVVSAPDLRFYFGWRQDHKPAEQDAPADLWSSAVGFSWALSLFGAQQMTNVLNPSGSGKSFQSLKNAAEAELNEPFRAAFRAGDTLQRGVIEIARGGLGGEIFDPTRWMRLFANIMQPSAQSTPPPPPKSPPTASWTAPPAAAPPVQASPPRSVPPSSPPPGAQTGWGPMPGSAPAGGTSAAPAPGAPPAPVNIGEADISPDYPYEPHYCDVFGSRMHYIEQGTGDVILLLHGNPSWSYSWRNIIPHLSRLGRCIAPDLIGFGKSDKPDIEYLWFDHARYLEQFIRKMGLKNITLVLHDQGSALGFHYAMRNERNIKAIAFFEALVRPFTWENFSTPAFQQVFRQFRTGGKGGLGWDLIVDKNVFIEQLLPQASGRGFDEKTMNYYRDPFRKPASRLPIWQFPRQTAIGGEPKDVWDAVTDYSERLQGSILPKLMLYATPGALLTREHVEWCQENFPNLKSVDIGPGLHFLDESSPNRIGREIAAWLEGMAKHGA